MDGHLPFLGWSSINPGMVTHQKDVNYRLRLYHFELTKLIPSNNCHGWSPTIPRMVDHQPNDGHPPEQQEPHLNFLGRSSTRG